MDGEASDYLVVMGKGGVGIDWIKLQMSSKSGNAS